MRRKQNNQGFSLLEVVLSMAILAIISIPLLSYFTQSVKYNAKMADKQHATNLGQEIMESLKDQPNLVQNVTDAGLSVPYLMNQGYVSTGYTPTDPTSTVIGGTESFYGQADLIGEKYDVTVEVSTNTNENVSQMPQIDGIDDTKDVVALENDQMQDALTYFAAENAQAAALSAEDEEPLQVMSTDEIKARMKRTISITVQSAYVRVACFYQCKGVPGVDETEQYDCSDMAEEDIRNVEHIYLMYKVQQNKDYVQLQCEAGVTVPKLVIVCQNIDEVNTTYQSYQMIISPQAGCTMPVVASNLGKPSYENKAITNEGEIWKDSYKLSNSNIEALVEKQQGIRNVNVVVSVYKKDKGNGPDKEDYRYITVDSAKGE